MLPVFCYSYYASAASFPVGPPRIVPPLKRQRLMASSTRNNKTNQSQKSSTVPPLDQLKVYSKYRTIWIMHAKLSGAGAAAEGSRDVINDGRREKPWLFGYIKKLTFFWRGGQAKIANKAEDVQILMQFCKAPAHFLPTVIFIKKKKRKSMLFQQKEK